MTHFLIEDCGSEGCKVYIRGWFKYHPFAVVVDDEAAMSLIHWYCGTTSYVIKFK